MIVDNLYKIQVGTQFSFTLRALVSDTTVTPSIDTPVDITDNEIECEIEKHHEKTVTLAGSVLDGPDGRCLITIPSAVSAELDPGTMVEFRFRRRPPGSDWIPMGVLQLEVI